MSGCKTNKIKIGKTINALKKKFKVIIWGKSRAYDQW